MADWRAAGESVSLLIDGAAPDETALAETALAETALAETVLAKYNEGDDLPPDHSPRPWLHPVRTLGGRIMTGASPDDHRHHYGASMAVPDVDGTSYWGGRTWVRGQGSTLLDNHGRQRRRSLVVDGAELRERIVWQNERGEEQLSETRRLTARMLPDATGWVLDWSSTLRAENSDVTIGSPATNGRQGAGYGGIFWRLAERGSTTVLSELGEGEARAHQSRSAWVALNQSSLNQSASNEPAGEERVSLLLSQPESGSRPWFVRATEYAGAGPMLAADERLRIPGGSQITTSIRAVLLDRWVDDAADAQFLLTEARRDGND